MRHKTLGHKEYNKGELLIENSHLVGGAVEVDMNTIEQKFDFKGPYNKSPEFFDVKKFPAFYIRNDYEGVGNME